MNLLDKWRTYQLLKKLEEKATEEIKMNEQVKSGWQTTQFWVTILANAPALAGLIAGHDSQAAIIVATLVNCVYVIARTLHYKWAQEATLPTVSTPKGLEG